MSDITRPSCLGPRLGPTRRPYLFRPLFPHLFTAGEWWATVGTTVSQCVCLPRCKSPSLLPSSISSSTFPLTDHHHISFFIQHSYAPPSPQHEKMPLIGLKRRASGDHATQPPLEKKRSRIFRRVSAGSLPRATIARPEPALLSIAGLRRRGSHILDRLNLRRCEWMVGTRGVLCADMLKTR